MSNRRTHHEWLEKFWSYPLQAKYKPDSKSVRVSFTVPIPAPLFYEDRFGNTYVNKLCATLDMLFLSIQVTKFAFEELYYTK